MNEPTKPLTLAQQYARTPEGRAKTAERMRRYFASPKGIEARARAKARQLAYYATPEGKAARKLARERYAASPAAQAKAAASLLVHRTRKRGDGPIYG